MAQSQPKEDAAQEQQRREQAIHEATLRWQAIFGPVHFDDPIFECMIYLHPKPMSDFLPLDDRKLPRPLISGHTMWMELFFKGPFQGAVSKVPATRYYLKRNDKTESDLLLYEGRDGDEEIRMMESGIACLLTIRPKDYQPEKGVDAESISRIMFDRVRLTYPTIEKLNEAFKLQGTAHLGDLFISNPKLTRKQIGLIRGWTDCVFVFVGKDGLSIFLFKAQAGRAAMGLPYDFDWLKKSF